MSKSDYNNSVEEEFFSILEKISELTYEVHSITKSKHFNPDVDLVIIDDRYKKRNQQINKLNEFLSNSEGVKLITKNKKWDEFMNSIISTENENITFLQSKVNETKEKLIDINKKKSLLVYEKMIK